MSELAKALVAARKELKGTVFKSGINQHQRYAYVGHEAVITGGARDALNNHGLALVQVSVEHVGEVPGGKTKCMLWRGAYELLHESGEKMSFSFVATTQENDKSAFVASTSLDRTAHLRVLALAGSSEEDPEHDSHDRAAQQQQRTPQAPAPQQAPAQQQPANGATKKETLCERIGRELYEETRTAAQLAKLRAEANEHRPTFSPEENEYIRKAVAYAMARVARAEADEAEALQAEAALARRTQEAAAGPQTPFPTSPTAPTPTPTSKTGATPPATRPTTVEKGVAQ
jgi:hypothetical protein